MGISGGPNIVDNGLVLSLDAADVYTPINRNLLTYTNDLSNGAWAKIRCQITSSATIAPDGTNTAFALTITDQTGLVRLSQSPISGSISGGPFTFSVYAKQNTISASLFDTGVYNTSTTSGSEPSYNILNNFAVTGSNGAYVSNRSVTSVGNGWYRLATTATISNNSVWYLFFDIEDGAGAKTNGQSLYLWGPQFEYGSIATEYQPVVTTTRTWPNVIDQSSVGTLSNNPTVDLTTNKNIVFDGVDDIIIGYNNVLPNTNTCTLEMFVNVSTISTYGQLFYIGQSSFNHNIPYVCFCTLISPNRFCFSTNKSSGGSRLVHLVSDSNFTTGVWHHCVGTMGDGLLKLYIDNVYIGSYTLPVDYVADIGGQSAYIGGGLSTGFVTDVSCKVGVARAYNRVLTSSEIEQNYYALKSRFNI
jgi:hypothetical protein